MSDMESSITPVGFIQHHRFRTKNHGYEVWYISLNTSGNVAISGHRNDGRTFIDLYSGSYSASEDNLKLYFSKEFEIYLTYFFRYVSFLDENPNEIVTCIGDKVQIIGIHGNENILRSLTVDGGASCLAVEKGEIFLGLLGTSTVIVLNFELQKTRSINIRGLRSGDYPTDIAVTSDAIFVCSAYGKASQREADGSILKAYTAETGQYSSAESITECEDLGLVAIVWNGEGIIFYPVNEDKCYLLYVDPGVTRIRFSVQERLIITAHGNTGEVKMYELKQFFSFDGMKRTLAHLLSPRECNDIAKHFGIEGFAMSRYDECQDFKASESLFTTLKKKRLLDYYDLENIKKAVDTFNNETRGIILNGPIEGYELHGLLKVSSTDLLTEMMTKENAWRKERNQLSDQLQTKTSCIKEKEECISDLRKELERVKKDCDETVKVLGEELNEKRRTIEVVKQQSADEVTKLSADFDNKIKDQEKRNLGLIQKLKKVTRDYDETIKTLKRELAENGQKFEAERTQSAGTVKKLSEELRRSRKAIEINESKYKKEIETLQQGHQRAEKLLEQKERDKLHFSKEISALKEVLNETKERIAATQKERNTGKKKPALVSSPSEELNEELSSPPAQFGRLIVSVGENLTLDDSLKLATLFNLTTSECDMLRLVSAHETPGIRCLEIMKKRNFINVYDVTNLQAAFRILKLQKINNELLTPYQEAIHTDVRKKYRAKPLYFNENRMSTDFERKASRDGNSQGDKLNKQAKVLAPNGASLGDGERIVPYIEHNIGKVGGKITLSGICFSIPGNTFTKDQVVAIAVHRTPDIELPHNNTRITPLIELKPLGMKLKNPACLVIPHSALIPEPERHQITVFSGIISKNGITWKEERSLKRKLKCKDVEVEVLDFTYLSVSLNSTSPILTFIKRAVLLLDELQNPDDDIILTLCFCGDNDIEYQELLLDYKSKLPVEGFSTFRVNYNQDSDPNESFLKLVVSTMSTTYECADKEMICSVRHICAASRVSHQFKMTKNRSDTSDRIDVEIRLYQNQAILTKVFLNTKVKNLAISKQTRKMLDGRICTDNSDNYEAMKQAISLKLSKEDCQKLAKHFHLSKEDENSILASGNSGAALLNILQVKNLLSETRLVDMFESLNKSQLAEIAHIVSQYVDSKKRDDFNSPTTDENLKIRDYVWIANDFVQYLGPVCLKELLQIQAGVWNVHVPCRYEC